MKAMYELLNEARQQGIELSTIATPIENNHGFDIYESEDFYLIDRRYGEGFDEYPKDYYTLDEAIDEQANKSRFINNLIRKSISK